MGAGDVARAGNVAGLETFSPLRNFTYTKAHPECGLLRVWGLFPYISVHDIIIEYYR